MKKKFSSTHLIILIISLSTIAVLMFMWTASSLASPAQTQDAPLAPILPPTMVNYQGTIRKDGSPYNGTGYFKFAVMNSPSGNGTSNYWAHDGTTAYTPTTYITLTVTNGLFNVLLGDTSVTSMTEIISDTVFQFSNSYLRVWFSDDGSSFQALEPNQKFASVAYALRCTTCEYANNYTETDPVFVASDAYPITTLQITHWDYAYNNYDTTDDDWTDNPGNTQVSTNLDVGIGGPNPSTLLHIKDGNSTTPQILVEAGGTGDAAMQYFQGGSNNFSIGIDDTDNNFKLTAGTSLATSSQGDGSTMMLARSNGILDFNNQSRTRAFLTHRQFIQWNTWTPIEFDDDMTMTGGYDQQGEFTLWSPTGTLAQFTATEEGYYQVHSRAYFEHYEPQQPFPNGYISIAIWVNGVPYADGNILQMVFPNFPPIEEPYTLLINNNAPNVSDVVYLNVGDVVEIFVIQTVDTGTNSFSLFFGTNQTYVSIHKDS